MSATFLTSGARGEVAELTRAHTRKGQIAVLRRNGVPFVDSADGWPVVARVAVEGGKQPAQDSRPWQPDVLRKAG